MADINVTITEKEIISVTISGGSGTSNHASLSNLDYASAGHTGFQKTIEWDEFYRSFLIDKP